MDDVEILALLAESPSIDKVAKRSGASPEHVSAIKADGGRAAAWYQDRVLRGLTSTRVQIEASRTFGAPDGERPSDTTTARNGTDEIWTWIAIDLHSLLIVSWLVADRDRDAAKFFVNDVASRIAHPVKLVAGDDDELYLDAVDGATGIDETILSTLYASPDEDTGGERPIEQSFAEQQKLVAHLRCRRFDRFAPALSTTIEDHAHGLALSAMHNNFVRIFDGLGTAPAVAAGIIDAPWAASLIADVLRMWRDLKIGPWYQRVVVLGSAKATQEHRPSFDVLVGLKLSIVRRAADMLVLHFGNVRAHPSGEGTVGDYALHVQCAWRFSGPSGIVTGRRDLWQYAGPGQWPETWRYDDGFSLQDKIFDRVIGSYDASTGSWFNERNRFIVTSVSRTDHGDVRLSMSDGYEIFIFPDGSEGAGEAWRFFAPGRPHHLVFPEERGS